MRAIAVLAILPLGLGLPATASADVWQDRVIYDDRPAGAQSLTSSSKVLYLNDCLPNGCAVTASSSDSSINNTSSIPDANTTLSAYRWGTPHWDRIVECVRKTMAPFDITITTDDPGTSPHYEVMVAGTPDELRPGLEAGGIAPFISCNATRNNVLVFVFAGSTSTEPYLCAAIAHEAGHAYGLSHSLDALDPMTYKELGSSKTWQNSDSQCGTTSPESCRCFDTTQNTFRYMQETWGLSPSVTPPSLTLLKPRDGQWVPPNFPMVGVYSSQLEMLDATLKLDGAVIETATRPPLAWNAPALATGDHVVSLTVSDFGDRAVTATSTVHVMSSCASAEPCADGFVCLGGLCMPGATVGGGLGATCLEASECVTDNCASDGTTAYCAGACDAGSVCPSGFTCIPDANLCWPVVAEDSGCATSDGSAHGLVLFGLGALLFARRRRRGRR